MPFLRVLLVSSLLFALCGCQIIYKLPTRQGNVLDQRDLDKLKMGMTRDQVKFLMGTPIATNPFRDDRWDYLGYYKSPRGKVTTRTVSIYFTGDTVAKMDGLAPEATINALSAPDAATVIKQGKEIEKDRAEKKEAPPILVDDPKEQNP